MQKQIVNLEFGQGVIFGTTDTLKNTGTKYFLGFDDSCEEICNEKTFVVDATAGKIVLSNTLRRTCSVKANQGARH